jgi:hypothetical protein
MFSIDYDATRALVRARMWGFMTPDEVIGFSRQEQQIVADMGCGSGEFLLLIDTDGAVIQSQEVVAGFMELVANSPLKARRIAVVRGSSLTRMQTQRILMIRDNAAIFATMPEAEEWLFAPEQPAQVAAEG